MSEIATPRQIGAVIREERQRKGLTQQQLADRAGVSRGFVNRLEKGSAAAVYPEKLFAVLSALGLRMILEVSEGACAFEPNGNAVLVAGQAIPLMSQAVSGLANTANAAAQTLLQQNASIGQRLAELGCMANALASEQLKGSMRSLGSIYANANLPAASPLFASRNEDEGPSSGRES